ncbi:RNA polymerase sigma factor SigJ [Kiloniella sp. b19]|uniref:RNA polymerase sigma factor SigJ n=1 Tax=Kiloniella sp. GXU_MW_B19 TaxID=3141326 RepID=UPI0031E09111
MAKSDAKTDAFEQARPRLMGIAYRLLGTLSEAEDAVQDTACRWFVGGFEEPENPVAWLSRVCTNRCLDILKSAQRARTDYIGPWFPDQFQLEGEGLASPEEQLALSSSLNTAFLLLLERLSPKERAAYILHDIFAMHFGDVAEALDLSEAACRKLASRARQMVTREEVRFVPEPEIQNHLLTLFRETLNSGDASHLAEALSQDVRLRADSGGKAVAIREVLSGYDAVVRFVLKVLVGAWGQGKAVLETRSVNGLPGLVIHKEGKLLAAVSFAFTAENRIADIFVLRHPDKLEQLVGTSLQSRGTGLLPASE